MSDSPQVPKQSGGSIAGPLVLGGLALLPYPLVLLGTVMGLAALADGTPRPVVGFLGKTFLVTSTAYPLVYLVCLGLALGARRTDPAKAAQFALAPLVYVGAVIVLYMFTTWLEARPAGQLLDGSVPAQPPEISTYLDTRCGQSQFRVLRRAHSESAPALRYVLGGATPAANQPELAEVHVTREGHAFHAKCIRTRENRTYLLFSDCNGPCSSGNFGLVDADTGRIVVWPLTREAMAGGEIARLLGFEPTDLKDDPEKLCCDANTEFKR